MLFDALHCGNTIKPRTFFTLLFYISMPLENAAMHRRGEAQTNENVLTCIRTSVRKYVLTLSSMFSPIFHAI